MKIRKSIDFLVGIAEDDKSFRTSHHSFTNFKLPPLVFSQHCGINKAEKIPNITQDDGTYIPTSILYVITLIR